MTDSLKFGTSGLRGLATDLVGEASRRYAAAFVRYLRSIGQGEGELLIGRDLRDSSAAMSQSVIAAVAAEGMTPVDCGELPTPALALAAMSRGVPAIMVTGSHIPADRNGLKFYVAAGEITKADESGILGALSEAPESPVNSTTSGDALAQYLSRFDGMLPPNALSGWRIGVWQHSSVSRDLLADIIGEFGAEIVPLGRSAVFVPVDTEAVDGATAAQLAQWVAEHRLDALVSTDGDADRPLLVDERGALVRGDVLGALTARFVGAATAVTPVTSNSAIEQSGFFEGVVRTKVGSPYVISGMEGAAAPVVGFEANGGVLLGSDVTVNGTELTALPTRDAVLPILAVLGAARAAGQTVSQQVATLPSRVARSDRLEHVPQERSAALLHQLKSNPEPFFTPQGEIEAISDVDGLRYTLVGGDVVHYRPSGNAPELRCYTESATPERADELLAWGLKAAEAVVR